MLYWVQMMKELQSVRFMLNLPPNVRVFQASQYLAQDTIKQEILPAIPIQQEFTNKEGVQFLQFNTALAIKEM